MSGIHPRPSRKSSDFSIERILADSSTRSSTCNNSIKSHTVDPGLFHQCEKNSKEDNNKTSIMSEFVDRSIVHSPSTSGLFEVNDVEKKFDSSSSPSEDYGANHLYWLQCTRYKPPKIPRKSLVGKVCRRKPATHPRIPFTSLQLEVLEEKYKRDAYLSRKDVMQLSMTLRLPHSRIKIWFQNRRARDRRESKVTSSSPSFQDNL